MLPPSLQLYASTYSRVPLPTPTTYRYYPPLLPTATTYRYYLPLLPTATTYRYYLPLLPTATTYRYYLPLLPTATTSATTHRYPATGVRSIPTNAPIGGGQRAPHSTNVHLTRYIRYIA